MNTTNKQELPRFQFICANGCGTCGVKLVEFETHRSETLTGELIERTAIPDLVSTCCGAGVEIWDEAKQDTTGHRTILDDAPSANTAQPSEATSAPMAVEAMRESLQRIAQNGEQMATDESQSKSSQSMWAICAADAREALASHAAPAVAVGELGTNFADPDDIEVGNAIRDACFHDVAEARKDMRRVLTNFIRLRKINSPVAHPSPAAPAQEQAKALTPLSDEQIWQAYMEYPVDIDCHVSDLHKFARAIETAHGIGGTAGGGGRDDAK